MFKDSRGEIKALRGKESKIERVKERRFFNEKKGGKRTFLFIQVVT